ncbi:hypothetical protein WR25_04218 [Diploscapter pachys]|uniref:EF-hand domain-containing protein n=1 Tax=Diploscapter pachys TaxID=2018661 RepID=A0A2A2K1M8_9BILA|nr:hypothetical protein WR25_04218 [Diploscapter pachys]
MAIFIKILLTSIVLVNSISSFTYYDLHPDDEKKTADNLIGNLVDQVVSWTFTANRSTNCSEGQLTREDFLIMAYCPDEYIEDCWEDSDTNKDGCLSLDEVVRMREMARVRNMYLRYMVDTFHDVDSNNDKVVDKGEADEYARSQWHIVIDKNWDSLYKKEDANKDGVLDETEFMHLMDDKNSAPLEYSFSGPSHTTTIDSANEDIIDQ